MFGSRGKKTAAASSSSKKKEEASVEEIQRTFLLFAGETASFVFSS
jgi:hypothetical protein